MSTEDVTVSLSRLALAKAIKTPDAGEKEAEPWTKSIIFHQAHIDPQMRQSILNPQQQRRNNRQPRQQYRQQQHHQQPQPQQQRYPSQQPRNASPMQRVRSDEMPATIRQPVRPQPPSQRPSSNSSGGRSSLSSGKIGK
jgi:hypothetical protein